LLDYATQQAGAGIGTWRDDLEHIEKAFLFGAMGARNGVTAALVVRSGWTGMNDVLAGPQNFIKSYAPKADPAKLTEDLGKRYEVSLTSIKSWTAGGPILSILDAIVNLRKRRPFEANDVRHVVVRSATSQAERVNKREMPDINVQYLVAVMLIDKTVSFHAAHDKERMQDPAILREEAKVELIGDEELERILPTRVGVVEIELTDGTHLTERVENARGTPENPMTREEIVAKARSLMTPVLGAPTATKLIDRLLEIESIKNIRDLRPLLQRA
jgi:2-methylcitrate dehydratase PrpD